MFRKSLPPANHQRIVHRLSASQLLVLWTGGWLCTMVLCWGGIALLIHPSVVTLSFHQENPISVIEPKQIYAPTTPLHPIQAPPKSTSREFSAVPILGLALICIMGSRLMMGRMRS
ncbi:MAG: hypothetical protein WBA10_16970, partial [Elainellaceae cyanobacterium]